MTSVSSPVYFLKRKANDASSVNEHDKENVEQQKTNQLAQLPVDRPAFVKGEKRFKREVDQDEEPKQAKIKIKATNTEKKLKQNLRRQSGGRPPIRLKRKPRKPVAVPRNSLIPKCTNNDIDRFLETALADAEHQPKRTEEYFGLKECLSALVEEQQKLRAQNRELEKTVQEKYSCCQELMEAVKEERNNFSDRCGILQENIRKALAFVKDAPADVVKDHLLSIEKQGRELLKHSAKWYTETLEEYQVSFNSLLALYELGFPAETYSSLTTRMQEQENIVVFFFDKSATHTETSHFVEVLEGLKRWKQADHTTHFCFVFLDGVSRPSFINWSLPFSTHSEIHHWSKQSRTVSLISSPPLNGWSWKKTSEKECVGEFRNGKLCGIGKWLSVDGRSYEGTFKEDLFDGKGRKMWPSGTMYHGEFKEGKLHGVGMYVWPSGTMYEGEFRDNKFNGRGRKIWADGTVYEGEFKSGIMNGRGKKVWPSKTVYEGNFKDNMLHGKGKICWPDGTVYEGIFQSNMFHGKGRLVLSGGEVQEGEFRDGKFFEAESSTSSGVKDFLKSLKNFKVNFRKKANVASMSE